MRGRLPSPCYNTLRKAIRACILTSMPLLPWTHCGNEGAVVRNPVPVLFDRTPAAGDPSAPISALTVGAVGDGVTDNADALTIIFADAKSGAYYFPPGSYRLSCGHYFIAASAVS